MEERVKKKKKSLKIAVSIVLLCACILLSGCSGCPTIKPGQPSYDKAETAIKEGNKFFGMYIVEDVKWSELDDDSASESIRSAYGFVNIIASLGLSNLLKINQLPLSQTSISTVNVDFTPEGIASKMGTATTQILQEDALTPAKDGIMAFAIGLFLFMWGINMAMKMTNIDHSTEEIIRNMIFLAIGILLITNADTIVFQLIKIGDEIEITDDNPDNNILESFRTWAENDPGEQVTLLGFGVMARKPEDVTWIPVPNLFEMAPQQYVQRVIATAIPFLPAMICSFMVISMLITRFLELFIRVYFSAIPIAMTMYNGWTEGTARYFRSTMAAVFQIVLIKLGTAMINPIIKMIFQAITGYGTTNAYNTLFTPGEVQTIDQVLEYGSFFPPVTIFLAAIFVAFGYCVLIGYLKQTRKLSELIFHV